MRTLLCPRCHHRLHDRLIVYRCLTARCGFSIRKIGRGHQLPTSGVIFKRGNFKTIDIWQMEDLKDNISFKTRSRHQTKTEYHHPSYSNHG